MMLIAYWIITESFDGTRLVSDVIICYIWCRCYCTNWYIMLVAQMLCALAAIGSLISPIIAKIFMEAFENRAITAALHPQDMEKVCR